MKFIALSTAVLAGSALGAPSYPAPAAVGYAQPAVVGYAQQAYAAVAPIAVKPATHAVQEQVHYGQPIAETYVQHGVVGHKAVQVGSQAVQVGHQYGVHSQELIAQQPYSYVAGAPQSYSNTVAVPAPALPVAPYTGAIIPPAPVNYGPAPADTVTQQKVLAPVRTHTRITPVATRIVPKLDVQQVPYEVRVNVPVPVHRDVIVQKKVAAPYNVAVPHPVPVAAPYKVHPVQNVVHTPVVREKTYSVHQPIVHTAHAVHATVGAHAGYY